MISIELTADARAVLAQLRDAPAQALPTMARALDLENEMTVGFIQRTKLSQAGPETLAVRTGRLRRSVRPSKTRIVGQTLIASIGSNVSYAGAHEYGTGPYTIKAKNKKALTIATPGGIILRRSARHPGHKERGFIRFSLWQRRRRYSKRLSTAITNLISHE